MSPVFVTLILLTAVASLFYFLNYFSNSDRKKKENLFLQLSKEGTSNNLVFCSQEILQNKVIGIDGIHRKIMILEKIKNNYNYSVISLDEVEHCELVKSCGSLHVANLKKFDIEKKREAIELQFEFKNHTQPASIKFYDSFVNSKREFELLKAKAEYWSTMFSKMLTHQQVSLRA